MWTELVVFGLTLLRFTLETLTNFCYLIALHDRNSVTRALRYDVLKKLNLDLYAITVTVFFVSNSWNNLTNDPADKYYK